jgi:hypothetical protein
MKEIDADRKKGRASEKYEEETSISLNGGGGGSEKAK